jgi:hypothetical protein
MRTNFPTQHDARHMTRRRFGIFHRLGFWLIASSLLISCGRPSGSGGSLEEAWDHVNDPLRLGQGWIRDFSQLPVTGQLERKPWSDSYWPSRSGGIADRWRDYEADTFAYEFYSLDQLRALSPLQVSRLSPAEKFDILLGQYDYPLVQGERLRTSPDAQGWEGLCHGWASAALSYPEPQATLVVNNDGISIPFGAADIKALLTYWDGEVSYGYSRGLGGRCNIDLDENPDDATRPECRDANAGAFHVVLANKIGIRNEGFVADVTRSLQVWNQPVFGFETKVLGERGPSPGAAPDAVREVEVETQMSYTVETRARWNADRDENPGPSVRSATYSYVVELNSQGEIVGGEWLTEERPDFLWTRERAEFSNGWEMLGELLQLATQGEELEEPTEAPRG